MTGAQKKTDAYKMKGSQKTREYELTGAQKKIDAYRLMDSQKTREYNLSGAQKTDENSSCVKCGRMTALKSFMRENVHAKMLT